MLLESAQAIVFAGVTLVATLSLPAVQESTCCTHDTLTVSISGGVVEQVAPSGVASVAVLDLGDSSCS